MGIVEALAAGAIPVVSEDTVLPWEDTDLLTDWDSCVVRVTTAEIFALPKLLRSFGAPGSLSYFQRHAACRRIWHLLAGIDAERFGIAAFERRVHLIFWDVLKRRISR